MSDKVKITIDGVEITAKPGQTIMEAADEAGIYITRLCKAEGLLPSGRCRICTVNVNGRPMAACTTPVTDGMIILNNTEALNECRKAIVEMLFVEGNHICAFCEASGNCELQALAYRLGMMVPRYPFMFPRREIDMSHPDIWIDRNRCIQCGRCVQASRDVDGKNVFGFVDRGTEMRIAINTEGELSDTQIEAVDRAVQVCPTGALLIKRHGYRDPYGKRKYDKTPIGSDIEARRSPQVSQH